MARRPRLALVVVGFNKRKETKMKKEERDLLTEYFSFIGFNILHFNLPKESNGVDLWVRKNGRPLSVEVKKVRKQKNGCFQVDPVCKNRKNDDLIAIIVGSDYVLIEPMKDHLSACSPKGTRQFTWIGS